MTSPGTAQAVPRHPAEPQAVVPRARHATPQWVIIPNNPGIATALAAIYKGGPNARSLIGGWSEDAGGNPICRHLGNKGGMILVYVDPVTTAAGSVPTAEDMWRFIDGLSAFTADVALADAEARLEPSALGQKRLDHRPFFVRQIESHDQTPFQGASITFP